MHLAGGFAGWEGGEEKVTTERKWRPHLMGFGGVIAEISGAYSAKWGLESRNVLSQ